MTSQADIIIIHARIFTAHHENPQAEAVAIQGRHILYVGDTETALSYRTKQTRIIDAQQKTLLPGLIDSHFHLDEGSHMLTQLDLQAATTLAEVRLKIKQSQFTETDWIIGHSLSYFLKDASPLTRHHLDAIESNRPLMLIAFDLHTIWANTVALELAGLLQGGDTAQGSRIVMGTDGLASGELREPGAYQPLLDKRPAWTETQYREHLQMGMRLANSLGITSIHNMDGNPSKLARYHDLAQNNALTLRIDVPYDVKPETPLSALEHEALPMRDQQNDWISAGNIKVFMDGVIESGTAFVLDAYPDGTHGNTLYSAEHFNAIAAEADRLGLQIKVHAVGDAAVRRTLDGFEYAQRKNGKRDSRHRIEHIELLNPADLARFAQLGVIASMQPIHCPMTIDGDDVWFGQVSRDRFDWAFPWQTLREAGVKLAFGSDFPVASLNPFEGIACAVNRPLWQPNTRSHRQTLHDTLMSYTADASYTAFNTHTGQIRTGFFADMVLLDVDLFAIDPIAIADVTPLMTICDGRIVYER